MMVLSGVRIRILASVVISGVMFGGLSVAGPYVAFAEQCVGTNEREPLDNDGVSFSVKINSCKAQELVDAYGDAKDAAGLVGALGAKWWPVGIASGVFFGWSWQNQSQVKGAAAAGRGVEFLEVEGVIMQARAQR